MDKKIILAAAFAAFGLAQEAQAQTNIQTFYDFGKDRQHVTTTIEGFYPDKWGNTFFFVDYDYNSKNADKKVYAPSGTYFEIARCLNFWQKTALSPLSLHVEYNGGVYNGFTVNNAGLVGLDWFLHSADFNNTFNLKVLYKGINYNGAINMDGSKANSDIPMQFTFVWGLRDLFGVKGLVFSGFADFWWEDHTSLTDNKGNLLGLPETSNFVFLSEPQIWYNVGRHFGVDNLSLGGEVELAYNFGVVKGFKFRPCLGAKWVF